jgi:exonuclease SbcD
MEEVLAAAPGDLRKDDYLLAVLTDREPLLNPMAKLRKFYPNALHIERPHFGAATGDGLSASDHRKMTPLDLFETFWKQTQDEELGEARRKVLVDTIKDVTGAEQ